MGINIDIFLKSFIFICESTSKENFNGISRKKWSSNGTG